MIAPNRVVVLSGWLYWASSVLLLLLPLAVLWALAQGWVSPAALASRFPVPPGTVVTLAKVIWTTAIGAVSLLAMLAALWHMRRLFDRYRHAEILSESCAQHILRIGQAMAVLALWSILAPTLQMLILTADNPDGSKVLTLGVEGNSLGLLLAGGLLIAIGWVMREAAREVEGFV